MTAQVVRAPAPPQWPAKLIGKPGVAPRPSWTNRIWFSFMTVMAAWAVFRIADHSVSLRVWLTFAGSWLVIGFGITGGYHRGFTHRGYVTSQWFKAILLVIGGWAVEGPLTRWRRTHELHHARNDQPGVDPHTPLEFSRLTPLDKTLIPAWQFWRRWEMMVPILVNQRGNIIEQNRYMNLRELLKGAWHSHMGWALRDRPGPKEFNEYRPVDRLEYLQDKYYLLVVIAGFIVTWAIAGFSWDGLIIAGFLRAFLLFHTTACINSVCHLVGKQLADPVVQARAKNSRNAVWWLILLIIASLGEAWHNMHHALSRCVAHGMGKRHIDITKYVIWVLEKLNIIREVQWLPKERAAILAYRPEDPTSVKPAFAG